jgi:hypothetical protein
VQFKTKCVSSAENSPSKEQLMCDRSADAVLAELLRAVSQSSRVEGRVVVLFADVFARHLYRELDFASIQHYAEDALGFSSSKTAQFIRLSKAFEEMPALRNAVACGEIEWTKAREVVRVAGPRTVERWLEVARSCSRRELTRRVTMTREEARRAAPKDQIDLAPTVAPAPFAEPPMPPCISSSALPASLERDLTPLADDAPVDVRLRFTGEAYARYQAILEALRKGGTRGSTEGVILESLEAKLNGGAGRSVSPPYKIVTFVCATCGTAHVPTERGDKRLSPSELAAQLSDAAVVGREGRRGRTIPPTIRARVLTRDGNRCQMRGCHRTSFLEVHHRVPRSRGGTNDADNLVF